MDEQKTRARASWKGAAKQTANPAYQQLPKSIFEGYRQTRSDGCEVLAIIHNGQGAQELKAGESGEVILDHTPFYADSGGQVGDKGWFYSDDHNTVVAEVTGCYSPIQGVRAHQVVAKQTIRVGDKVDAVVNADVRQSTMRNHTATHLLHAGLREVLGKHVKQAGSLVAPNHLRFDFSHFTAVEDEELQDIEDIINKEVLRNQIVETITDVPIDEAINTVSRDGAVRGKVWRQGARGADWRFLDRALRRHAHRRDRRDWADQDSEGRQRVVGRAARGGGYAARDRWRTSARIMNWKRWCRHSSLPPLRKNRAKMGHPLSEEIDACRDDLACRGFEG